MAVPLRCAASQRLAGKGLFRSGGLRPPQGHRHQKSRTAAGKSETCRASEWQSHLHSVIDEFIKATASYVPDVNLMLYFFRSPTSFSVLFSFDWPSIDWKAREPCSSLE